MSISGINASWQPPGLTDKRNFGAAVVERTLDTLNTSGSPAPVDKQTFGAAVVSKTFEYMNSNPESAKGASNDMSQTYDFAKSLLGAYAAGKGAIADIKT